MPLLRQLRHPCTLLLVARADRTGSEATRRLSAYPQCLLRSYATKPRDLSATATIPAAVPQPKVKKAKREPEDDSNSFFPRYKVDDPTWDIEDVARYRPNGWFPLRVVSPPLILSFTSLTPGRATASVVVSRFCKKLDTTRREHAGLLVISRCSRPTRTTSSRSRRSLVPTLSQVVQLANLMLPRPSRAPAGPALGLHLMIHYIRYKHRMRALKRGPNGPQKHRAPYTSMRPLARA